MTEQTRRSFSVNDISQRNGVGRSKIYEEIAAGRLRARIGSRACQGPVRKPRGGHERGRDVPCGRNFSAQALKRLSASQ